MGTLLAYIIKSSLCLIFLYLAYKTLLSKETFFRFNRMILLSVIILSWALPALQTATSPRIKTSGLPQNITEQIDIENKTGNHTKGNNTFSVSAERADNSSYTFNAGQTVETDHTSYIYLWMILCLYSSGILFLTGRNLYSFLRVCLLTGRNCKRIKKQGFTLIIHNRSDVAPFSWFGFIVIPSDAWKENATVILTHEAAHIQSRHSWDMIVADLTILLQWFNPAAWLIKQELQNVHEYEADRIVLDRGADAKEYQLLLIKKTVGSQLYSMASGFNHSNLKKRINMMLKKKSSSRARLKAFIILPLAVIAATVVGRPEINHPLDNLSTVQLTNQDTHKPGKRIITFPLLNEKTATADDVLNRYLQAIGGSENIDNIRSLTSTMLTNMNNGQYKTTTTIKNDGVEINTFVVTDSTGKAVNKFSGKQFYRISSDMLRIIQKKNSLNTLQVPILFDEQKFLVSGQKELLGIEKVNGRNAFHIQVTFSKDTKQDMFYDCESGLKVKSVVGKDFSISYDDYREESGILFPHKQTMTSPKYTYTVEILDVKINQD